MSPYDGARAAPRFRVDGPSDAPVCVLGPSLGTALELWDPQVAALSREWQVVRYDLRGHGGSPAPPGPYTVADLAGDVLDVVDRLGVGSFAYCGLSLGGAIGTWLAVHRQERLDALVVCCSAAKFGDPAAWRDRAAGVRAEGMEWLVPSSTERWFTARFPAAAPGETERLLGMLRAADPEGYAGCCEALAAFDVRDRLGEIRVPTRVIAGDADPATPVEVVRELAEGIPGAELVVVREAAHLANVEQPVAVTAAVVEHLRRAGVAGER